MTPGILAVYAGTSIVSGPSRNPFRSLNTRWLTDLYAHGAEAWNSAVSGAWTWNNLVRLQADIVAHAPDMVLFDTANDDSSDSSKAVLEAFVRLLRQNLPNAKLFFLRTADKDAWHKTLCEFYDMTSIDWRTWANAEVAAGRHVWTDWYTAPDYVHPNDAGAQSIEDFAEPIMQPVLSGGAQWSGDLGDYARQYADSADYENAATIKNGTDYDSRSGTWTNDGTAIQSSEVGAIATFSGTFRSFTTWRTASTTNTVDTRVDGGAWVLNQTMNYSTAYYLASRAAHTVDIRVASGTVRIDKFWAV